MGGHGTEFWNKRVLKSGHTGWNSPVTYAYDQLARVKAILIVNKNAAGIAFLLVGAAGADEFSAPFGMLGDTVKVMPASPLLLANLGEGWSVEPGHEVLMFQAIGGEVVFDIAILGTASEGGSDSSSGA